MNKLILHLSIFLSIFVSTGLSQAASLTDVQVGDKYYLGLNYLDQQDIINGYQNGEFRSNKSISKAETVVMALEANQLIDSEKLPTVTEKPFPDVEIDAWYAAYLQVAKDLNIISGNKDGNFEPKKDIELVEALRIILESTNPGKTYEVRPYDLHSDVSAEAWYAGYTSYAAWRTIINIYSNDTINPHQTMDRGYTAEIIYRTMREKEGFQFGKATFYGKAVQGNGTASGEIFDYNLFTAAHKGLPFGTMVRVTNTKNGKSVDVKINDRGPYGPGRVIDLSSSAFSQIASLGTGVINIQFQVISTP